LKKRAENQVISFIRENRTVTKVNEKPVYKLCRDM
jgi:hypothetical protein